MPRLVIYHFMAVPTLLRRQNKLSSADPMFGLPSNANATEITVHPAYNINSSYEIEKGVSGCPVEFES